MAFGQSRLEIGCSDMVWASLHSTGVDHLWLIIRGCPAAAFQLAQQLFRGHGREACALVAHRVRQNKPAGVNQRSAAIYDVRHVAITLLRNWLEQWLR